MERVAGVQTGGSERAFDLFMKARYLHEKHPGHGVTFATGTPVSNTMVELYTMQRYLDPDGLAAAGIDHFDAWAATFGEVVEAMEISPDGKSLRPRSRFAKFVNLPELQQMVRAFADVQTADMLNLPRPTLEGGKPITVACPMSDSQARLQDELVARYERIRSQKVDPREDNALAITTDGRKLALDARMLSPAAPDFPGSKLNALVGNVVAVWHKTAPTRGTQMVFCDLGVQPTAWGFSVYDDLVEKLVARGIPADQIACIGEADTDAKKQALFEQVRSGSVRSLIGSTAKLGTGTNVQRRLAALHHLDAPWKPAEVEQRDGRILRQGNRNAEVAVYRYVTEGSFDSYMWQALETKARFIAQVMTGETGVRKAEDVAGQELSYAEAKAIASGNPAVLTLAEADAEVQRLSVLRRHHADEQYLARKRVRELPEAIARLDRRLSALEGDAATVSVGDEFTVGDQPVTDALLARRLNAIPDHVEHTRRFPVGTFHGLAFGIERHPAGGADVYLEGQSVQKAMLSKESQGPRAVTNALNRIVSAYADDIAAAQRERALAETQLADYEARSGRPFPHAAYLDELAGLRDRLKIALSKKPADDEPTAAELAERVKALQAVHAAEAISTPFPVRNPVVVSSRRRGAAVLPPAEEPPSDPVGPPESDSPPSFRDHVRAHQPQRTLF